MTKDTAKTVERTAKTDFRLGDAYIGQGQVATLTQLQLKQLAAAGCVELDDDDNALVPKRELPPTQGEIDPPGPQADPHAKVLGGLDDLSDDELKSIAAENKINIEGLQSRDAIIAAVKTYAETNKPSAA